MSYPRDLWYTRVVVRLRNVFRGFVGDEFRSYVHPVASIEKLIVDEGFECASVAATAVWRVAIFERS